MDESVAAANPVNYESDEIPWIYTVVPVGTALPSYIQHETIDELFLEKPDSGSGRIAISEGWGNYTELLFTVDKYLGTTTPGRADSLKHGPRAQKNNLD